MKLSNHSDNNRPWQELLINALLFQLIWFIAIFSHWYWFILPVLFMLFHYFHTSHNKLYDVVMWGGLSVYGVLAETLLSQADLYVFPDNPPMLSAQSIPWFLVILWLAFAMTINRSLAWLVSKGILFIPLCAIVGPVSYIAARSAQAVEFNNQTLWLISLHWLVVGGLCVVMNRYFTQRQQQRNENA